MKACVSAVRVGLFCPPSSDTCRSVILQWFSSYFLSRVLFLPMVDSIETCRTEQTSLVSAVFLPLEKKFLEKLGLTFLFLKRPPPYKPQNLVWALRQQVLNEYRLASPRHFPSSAHCESPEQHLSSPSGGWGLAWFPKPCDRDPPAFSMTLFIKPWKTNSSVPCDPDTYIEPMLISTYFMPFC